MKFSHFQPGSLDVLVSHEEGKYYAHCLAFDLLAEGETAHEAMKTLAEMVFEYIRFFMDNRMEPFIFKPAPMQYWQILRTLREKQTFIPIVPKNLFQATSANRIAHYLNPVNAPACT